MDKNFKDFLKENTFLQNYKEKKTPNKKSNQKDDFLKILEIQTNHFKRKNQTPDESEEEKNEEATPKAEEFNDQQIISKFTKTTRETEIRQQKRIVQLYSRIHNMGREIDELKKINREMYSESKKQKKEIQKHQLEKEQYEKDRADQEKQIEIFKKLNHDNEDLIKQLKPIIGIASEEQDKVAMSIAKKKMKG